MEKNFTEIIHELGQEHRKIAGGKAANLGELSKKVMVPEGFVVLNNSFKKFLLYNDLTNLVNKLQKENSTELAQRVSKKILESVFPKPIEIEILERLYPPKTRFFAVRSSA
ncbi:MAG: phosphoenolpyruvate synthase, partial [Candidatus Diapherotrites archaeon]|nr:phosphoenolpyruvate synthase [Candidatus Diapherotrites archaeon]